MAMRVTIVGAGVHGVRMAQKYQLSTRASVRALVDRHPAGAPLPEGVPFLRSLGAWKKEFGAPTKNDLFDLCTHAAALPATLRALGKMGAKNIALPKPIATTARELATIERIIKQYHFKVFVTSQWAYSSLLPKMRAFIRAHRKDILRIDVEFSGSPAGPRAARYTAATAFLPHMLQILVSTGVLSEDAQPVIEESEPQRLRLSYYTPYPVHLVTDLTASSRTQTVIVWLRGKKKPALIANFSRSQTPEGHVEYPSLTVAPAHAKPAREDTLERMLAPLLGFYSKGGTAPATAFEQYLPVARHSIRIEEARIHQTVVVGGGVFGTLAALAISEQGNPVVLVERASKLLTAASLVNQCRVHMGYHYPRDSRTATESRKASGGFERFFKGAIERTFENYYLVATEDTLTSAERYRAFLDALRLPYKKRWPDELSFDRSKVALSLQVPEHSFDARLMREILEKKLAASPLVTVLYDADVASIEQRERGFHVGYHTKGGMQHLVANALVNATYANINQINALAGIAPRPYQYELCEVPVVRAPWKRSGWAILDGPFFGVMPFGFSDDFLFYDVELSVLERSIGTYPSFSKTVSFYDSKEARTRRFETWKKKWSAWFPEVKRAKSLYSLYTTRIVLPKQEHTDMRPTITEELLPGFWQIFSGKITTSLPQARALAKDIARVTRKRS